MTSRSPDSVNYYTTRADDQRMTYSEAMSSPADLEHDDDVVTDLAERARRTCSSVARHMRYQSGSSLPAGHLSALATIDEVGPISFSELADHEGVTRPTVTKMARVLSAQGLIDRHPDTVDRRVVRLTATARGRTRLQEERAQRLSYFLERLKALDHHQLVELHNALDIFDAALLNGDFSRTKATTRSIDEI